MTQYHTNLYSRIDSLLTYNKFALKLWKTLRHNSKTDYVVFIYSPCFLPKLPVVSMGAL